MAKGGDNERAKAKEWSLWFSHGADDNVFWRTNSGARATQRAKKGLTAANEYGDLICLHPKGEPLLRHVTIELKKGYNKKLDLFAVVDSAGRNTFMEFWMQVNRDADRAARAGWGGVPLLVVHRDRYKPIIAMPTYFYRRLDAWCGSLPENEPTIHLERANDDIMLMKLSAWFEWVTPEYFIAMHGEYGTA